MHTLKTIWERIKEHRRNKENKENNNNKKKEVKTVRIKNSKYKQISILFEDDEQYEKRLQEIQEDYRQKLARFHNQKLDDNETI